MSNINFNPSVELPVEVIVRAFRDEPVALHAINIQKGVIEVAGGDSGKTIGFPESLVYCFDGDIFDDLHSAYKDQQYEKLSDLWGRAAHCT